MNKSIITTLSLGVLAASASAQSVVAFWDQNSNVISSGFGFTTTSFPQSADQGSGALTLGNFDTTFVNNGTEDVYTYIQSFGGTTVGALAGVDAGGSLSPQGGSDLGGGAFANNGMNIDFSVSTLGFSGITISWAQRGTATGFTSREISFSSDGGANFIVVDTNTGALSSTFTQLTYDMTSVTALDENPNVVFRIVLDGATGSTGNNRFDNILITAAVPEPSTSALLLGALGLAFVLYRRRR